MAGSKPEETAEKLYIALLHYSLKGLGQGRQGRARTAASFLGFRGWTARRIERSVQLAIGMQLASKVYPA
jgi:hypothetical protein